MSVDFANEYSKPPHTNQTFNKKALIDDSFKFCWQGHRAKPGRHGE